MRSIGGAVLPEPVADPDSRSWDDLGGWREAPSCPEVGARELGVAPAKAGSLAGGLVPLGCGRPDAAAEIAVAICAATDGDASVRQPRTQLDDIRLPGGVVLGLFP